MASDASFNFALLEDCAPKRKNQFQVPKGKFYNPDTVVEIAMAGGYFLSTHIYDIHRASIFHQLSGIWSLVARWCLPMGPYGSRRVSPKFLQNPRAPRGTKVQSLPVTTGNLQLGHFTPGIGGFWGMDPQFEARMEVFFLEMYEKNDVDS